jgi:hypothetical protein
MTEFDFVSGGEGGHDTDFVNSITVSHDIIGKLAAYTEFFSVVSNARIQSGRGSSTWVSPTA